MWEENQSIDMQKWVAWSPYKSRLREIADNRRQVKQAAEDDTFNHLSASAMELDNQAYKTSDENLNKEYKKNSQLAAVSYMVKYAAKQNWADWSNLTTVSDIMSNYFNKFPETAPQIKEFINSDRDPEEFWIEMWWIENDRDEETLNWLERIWSDLKMPVDILVEWAYDLAWWGERATWNEWYADTLAIDDFALRKYWKTIANMTEEEIARLELDLDLERAKNWSYIMWDWEANVWWEYVPWKNRQRLDVAATELWLWWALSALEMAYPWPSAWLVALWETPIVNLPIQLFWEWGRLIWNLVSMIPWVDWWIASLPEDVQEEVKSIWWMLVLWKMIGKWTVKDWQIRPRLKNTINKITANDIIWWIMDFVSKYWDKLKESKLSNTLSDINNNPWNYVNMLWDWALDIVKNWWWWTSEAANSLWDTVKKFTKSSDFKKLEKQRKMDDKKMDSAWRISWAKWNKAIEQTETFKNELERLGNDVLKELDKKWITEEDLYDVMSEHSNWYEAWEDWIFSRNTVRYKPWQSRWVQNMRDSDTWISARPVVVDPIWNWIKYLRQIYKNDRNMTQTLDIIEKKWKTKWLTRAEANQLARQIAEWARIYKEWLRDMYTADYVQEIEQARRDLKDWAREPFKETVPWLYKALEYLDNAWSDNMNTKSMLRGNMENLRSYKNDYPAQEDWQKKWWTVTRTLSSRWKNVLDSIFQSRKYNPITRSAWLRNNIKDFIKNNKWEKNSYENIIKEWYDATFRDVVNPEWTSYYVWEWEVMYPKKWNWRDSRNYLEDIVEIVEDTSAEWGNPNRLINKYWNLESQLKQLWLSDAEIAEANNVIVQWWLFWWEPVEVANVEWWVLKKAKKPSSKKPSQEDTKWKKADSNPK